MESTVSNECPKVLVCDDEPHILESLSHIVSRLGLRCLLAEDGEEALAVARRERPDVMILDIRMPKLDGYAVCERIKSDPATRDIHVIVLTAFGQAADRVAADAAGADEFYVKPFSPRQLRERLRALFPEARS